MQKQQQTKKIYSEEQILYYKELYDILNENDINTYFDEMDKDIEISSDFRRKILQQVFQNDGKDGK